MEPSGQRRDHRADPVPDFTAPAYRLERLDLLFDGDPRAAVQMDSSSRTPRVKTLRNIFGNAWVLLGLAAFGVSLAILWRNPAFGREDAIGGILILGIAFPLLAWVTTLRARPLTVAVRRSGA